jgi:hypothetical protein
MPLGDFFFGYSDDPDGAVTLVLLAADDDTLAPSVMRCTAPPGAVSMRMM